VKKKNPDNRDGIECYGGHSSTYVYGHPASFNYVICEPVPEYKFGAEGKTEGYMV